MRRKAAVVLAITAFTVLAVLEAALGATFPAKAPGMVTDAANIIPSDKEAALEQLVRDYERKTSIEIAVVTVRSLEGLAPEDYAQELGTKWGVGKRGRDNGVLLLLAVAERKIRIHTGYGIEPDLTDAAAGRVIKEKMAPLLKKGSEDWGGGIAAGVQGIISGLGEKPYGARLEERNKPKQDGDAKASSSDADGAVILFILIAVAAVIMIIVIVAVGSASSSVSYGSSSRSSGPSRPSSRSSRKKSRDDDGGLTTGLVIGSILSGGGGGGGSRPSGGSGSGGGGIDLGGFGFGGGGFGGGGATGDF